MDNQERADKVRKLMRAQDMTMTRLSRRAKLHINTIHNVLDDKDVRVSTLHKIADALGVDASVLV